MIRGNKGSITKKVFAVTFIAITAFLLFCIVIQALFYEKIYIYQRKEFLNKTIDSFQEDYIHLSSDEEITQSITKHSNEGSSYIMVLDENGNIMYAVSYEMKIEMADGSVIRLSIDNAVRNEAFMKMDLSAGDEVTVDFIYFKGGKGRIYIPQRIVGERGEWAEEKAFGGFWEWGISGMRPEGGTRNAKGKILSIITPSSGQMSSVQRADVSRAVADWIRRLYMGQTLHADERITYLYQNGSNGDQYAVGVKKLINGQMIFAVTTLEPVQEAAKVMRGMFVPWFFGAMVLALLVAVVFSRMVTKPVVKISEITTKMKNLDFSQRCELNTNDELGDLAMNINEMSDQLSDTINRLMAANCKLSDDIRKERQLERQRKEFVATVSHELKTPLAIIRAYAEGLLDGVSEKKRQRYMNIIVDETKKMDSLVLDMLENARLEAGVEKMAIKTYNLVKIAEKVVKLLEQSCRNKAVTLTLYKQNDVEMALCDCDRIEQVIMNFMSNALRHTPPGGKIDVSVKETDGRAYLSVENSGSRICEEDLDKLWDRFYKADKARGRADGGTGLGLSIAKNILMLHQAKYGVENTAAGVCFWFSLKKGE